MSGKISASLLIALGIVLQGCAFTTEDGAFDLETDRTGAVDSKGFPVVVGPQYQREEPLIKNRERLRLEAELQALAEARKNPQINVDQRRDELLQKRLLQIARTHGKEAKDEIDASCVTDSEGNVNCKND